MALKFSGDVRDNWLDSLNADIGTNAKILIYDGTRPATGGGAVTTQVLLAELTGNGTAFGVVASGALTANAIAGDASANASGTASWFRVLTSGDVFIMDGDVGVSGSDMNIDIVEFVAGGPVEIASFVINAPNAA